MFTVCTAEHGGQKQIANADADDDTQRRTRPHKRNCVSMCQIINSSDLCVTRRQKVCLSVSVRVFVAL